MQLEGSRGSENLLLIGDETRFMKELTYCLQNLETQLARGNVLYFPELWCNLENNTKCFVCLDSDFLGVLGRSSLFTEKKKNPMSSQIDSKPFFQGDRS